MNDIKEKQKDCNYGDYFKFLSVIVYYLANDRHTIQIDIQSIDLQYFTNKYNYFVENKFFFYYT